MQMSGTKRRRRQEGCSLTSIAEEFGINKCIAWKAFQTTGTAVGKFDGNRPWKTTALTKRARYQSSSSVAQQQGDKCRGLLRPSQRSPIHPLGQETFRIAIK
ncbi:hypothetical protein TNCV_2017611 [Trichonephila clavipes]|nr:hypothetical protein TNCV_2017611 [Trichonephila clavipes]